MGFSRQEHWSGLPCPPPGDLPDPGIKAGRFFTMWPAKNVALHKHAPLFQKPLRTLGAICSLPLLWLLFQRRLFVGAPCLWLLCAFSQWETYVEDLSLGEVKAYFCLSLLLAASPDPPSASFAIVSAPVGSVHHGRWPWFLSSENTPLSHSLQFQVLWLLWRLPVLVSFTIPSLASQFFLIPWVKFLMFRKPRLGLP